MSRGATAVAGGAALTLPFAAASALAAPVCACGGGSSAGTAPPAPPTRDATPSPAPTPEPPPERRATPYLGSADAAERRAAQQREPRPRPRPAPSAQPAPSPRPYMGSANAAEHRMEQRRSAPAPQPRPEPAPAPRAPATPSPQPYMGSANAAEHRMERQRASAPAPQPQPAPAPPPQPQARPQIGSADALERRAGRAPEPRPAPPYMGSANAAEHRMEERRRADEAAGACTPLLPDRDRLCLPGPEEPAPPPPPPETRRETVDLCQPMVGPIARGQERPCEPVPAMTEAPSGGFACVPTQLPFSLPLDRGRGCRVVDPANAPAIAIRCQPARGPVRAENGLPCTREYEVPPPPPRPSEDYDGWLDPQRREAEREQRFDDAIPTSREWPVDDTQQREQGRLRTGLFIATETSGLCVGIGRFDACMKGEGDNRTFDPQFSPYATRAYLEVDFERDRAFVVANPTCSPNEGCSDAKHIGDGSLSDYSNEAQLERREDGSIRISWELANARLPGPMSGASIDGWMELRPREDGTMEVEMFGDRYPSWEMYYDDGCGRTEVLIQDPETRITDLLPTAGDRRVERTVPAEADC